MADAEEKNRDVGGLLETIYHYEDVIDHVLQDRIKGRLAGLGAPTVEECNVEIFRVFDEVFCGKAGGVPDAYSEGAKSLTKHITAYNETCDGSCASFSGTHPSKDEAIKLVEAWFMHRMNARNMRDIATMSCSDDE
jgi:hypothetical protein